MAKSAENIEHYFAANPKSKPRYGLIRTYLRGRPFEFLTASGVFSKQRVDLGTRLLIESMILPKKGCALDIGCGYGAVGIAAAALNQRLYVFLTDVNRRAVWLAKQNVEKNMINNAEVRNGCLYSPVKDMIFDCILSNPPVSAGMETVKAIIIEAPQHMACGGVFQMVVKSKVGGKRLRTIFEEAFGNFEVLARESGYRVLLSRKQ
ncbi:MAG: methyltransferase [Candidatus Bathyarchaeia archaeon]|jgi:16S rRNA G1207 methylase RsmC